MFLKEKRDSMVKARMCADGQNQKDGTWSKQETTSLTVATESVFITAIINGHKGCNIACFDIPGAFLHADVNEDITMVFKGRLVELMVQVVPNLYSLYITVDRNGTAILYVKIQKALYGLLKSALLVYMKLVAYLESVRFMLNPYDSCVANKVMNGKQMTVCWHVDNLKVLHCCDSAQVTIFKEWLSRKYGVVAERAGNGIPLYNSAASVSEREGAAGHLAHHCFSDHASEVAGQKRLGQGQEGADARHR